jgi:agmatinase
MRPAPQGLRERRSPTRGATALVQGCAGLDIVGGDVVEVAPMYDATTNTAQAGAQMLFEIVAVTAMARLGRPIR